MATKSELDSARSRARAKATNKRNEEFDQKTRRRGAQNRMTRSLENKGALRTAADALTTTPAEREAREDKRVSDLKTGRTRAGERLIAKRGKVRDAETKARVNAARQSEKKRKIDKLQKGADANISKLQKELRAKDTQRAVDNFTGETGKKARLSDAKRRVDANKAITMSPEDFANVPSVPPAKKKPFTKRMTAAEVKAMKANPLNAKKAAKPLGGTAPGIMLRDSGVKPRSKPTAAQVEKNQGKALSLFKSNQKKEKAKGAKDQAVIDSIKSDSKAKFGVGDKFVIRGNKANVTDTQLKKTGLTQAQYMKKWRASNKRPTAASSAKTTTKNTKTPKKVGFLRRVLLGKDGKFGGSRGAIDFLPGKSRKKKEDKPVNKMGGGMMKSKMSSKGGKRGGMSNGGLAMTKVNGKSVPAFAADGKGANDLAPTRRNMGGMMKSKGMSKGGAMKSKGMSKGGVMKPKGMSKGGAMKKKGYANGGAVRSKMASKGGKRGGVSRKATKPRGVGVAKRGFGKAMR